MARSISRLLLVAACVVGLAGCGAGVGTSINTAYAVCYNAGATTAEIDTLVRSLRIIRDDQLLSASDAVLSMIPSCGPNQGCLDCVTALVDAVY
jgi:hypothetical protein